MQEVKQVHTGIKEEKVGRGIYWGDGTQEQSFKPPLTSTKRPVRSDSDRRVLLHDFLIYSSGHVWTALKNRLGFIVLAWETSDGNKRLVNGMLWSLISIKGK